MNTTNTTSGIRDTAAAMATAILTLAVVVAVQSCLAWLLGPGGRGSLAVCITFASVMGVIFTLGTDRAVQYCVISHRITLAEALGLTFGVTAIGTALAAAVGVLLINSPLHYFAKATPTSFYLALCVIPALAMSTSLTFLLGAKRQFVYNGFTDLVNNGLRLVLTILLVWGAGLVWETDFSVEGSLVAMFLASAISSYLKLRGLDDETNLKVAWPKWEAIRAVTNYSVRYFVARLGNIVNATVGVLILGFFATTQEIGLFGAISLVVVRVLILPDSISKALLPRVGADEKGRPELVAQACRVSMILVGLCLSILAASSSVLVPVLFSPKFAPAVPLLWIMAPGVWVRGMTKPLYSYFIGVNRPGIVSLGTGVELVINFSVLPLLYGYLKISAAAWSMTLGFFTSSLVMAVAFRIVSGLSWRDSWFLNKADFKLLMDAAGKLPGLINNSSRPPN